MRSIEQARARFPVSHSLKSGETGKLTGSTGFPVLKITRWETGKPNSVRNLRAVRKRRFPGNFGFPTHWETGISEAA
jgi:hypothetical protein